MILNDQTKVLKLNQVGMKRNRLQVLLELILKMDLNGTVNVHVCVCVCVCDQYSWPLNVRLSFLAGTFRQWFLQTRR